VRDATAATPHCPSARPEMAGSVVFGVVNGTVEEPRVGYLSQPIPATPEVLALAGPASPGEVFRVGAPCAGAGCLHFDGGQCRLAQRIVQGLLPVVDTLPPCHLRPTCVWWKQEGREACLRCPQVVSQSVEPSPELAWAAAPGTSG
jgi:hypothetical protein